MTAISFPRQGRHQQVRGGYRIWVSVPAKGLRAVQAACAKFGPRAAGLGPSTAPALGACQFRRTGLTLLDGTDVCTGDALFRPVARDSEAQLHQRRERFQFANRFLPWDWHLPALALARRGGRRVECVGALPLFSGFLARATAACTAAPAEMPVNRPARGRKQEAGRYGNRGRV